MYIKCYEVYILITERTMYTEQVNARGVSIFLHLYHIARDINAFNAQNIIKYLLFKHLFAYLFIVLTAVL